MLYAVNIIVSARFQVARVTWRLNHTLFIIIQVINTIYRKK